MILLLVKCNEDKSLEWMKMFIMQCFEYFALVLRMPCSVDAWHFLY